MKMKTWLVCPAFAVLTTVGVLAADDAPPATGGQPANPNTVDPEAYKAAMERLKARTGPAPAAEAPTDLEGLKAENAALRQRVAELELMLGLKVRPGGGAVRPGGARTYGTLTELINTTKYPADPRKPWTDIQRERANHDIRANIIGARYQATAFFVDASSGKGAVNCRFRRTTKAEGGEQEYIKATFDARYSDLITSWRAGQGVTFAGTIASADLYQVQPKSEDPTRELRLRITLSDCVPK